MEIIDRDVDTAVKFEGVFGQGIDFIFRSEAPHVFFISYFKRMTSLSNVTFFAVPVSTSEFINENY